MSHLFSRLNAKLVTFLHLKTKFHRFYVLALFTKFSVVTTMLPIMAKLNTILKSECVNIWEFLHSLGKELKVMMMILFCNHTPDFEDFSILATNNNNSTVPLMESLLINRHHPPLNKNKQSLPLELFDN